MDKRIKIWQKHFSNHIKNSSTESEINCLTEDGWNKRIIIFEKILSNLIEKGVILPDALAVDLGCGTGKFCQIINEAGFNVIGIDLNRDMLKYSKTRLNDVDLINADCCHLPIVGKSFDFILSFGVISIIDDLQPFFQELKRILKDKSVILIQTLNKNYINYIFRTKFNFEFDINLNRGIKLIKYSSEKLERFYKIGAKRFSPKKMRKELWKLFPNSDIQIIPVFIFPKSLRIFEKFLQFLFPLYNLTYIFSFEYILLIKTRLN